MTKTITLDFSGHRRDERDQLPALLLAAGRGGGDSDQRFLPPGFLRTRACFEMATPARAASGETLHYDAAEGEVLVIELADGGVLVTSAARLRAALASVRPDLVGRRGEIRCDRLCRVAAARRGPLGEVAGGLISRIFALVVDSGDDAIVLAARKKLAELLAETTGDTLREQQTDWTTLGVSWLGSKALMWAIEEQLDHPPGLYCWDEPFARAIRAVGTHSADWGKRERDRAQSELQHAVRERRPALVFIHGLGSSTLGSFGDLLADQRMLWPALQRRFAGGIYAFEHRTLSESPIESALQLLAALPEGIEVSFVAHSRGGLVADLLCLQDFDSLLDDYRLELPGIGISNTGDGGVSVRQEVDAAHAGQRVQLRSLATQLAARRIVIRRYVRVASPAQGTQLASGNLDLFLSAILTLIGQVPFFFGSPLYSAFKRVVLEIARRRTHALLVPGIEAMLPESPLARLLREASVRAGIAMAVIAGDYEGGSLLQRLGILLTDFLLFDQVDNDLVVDSLSMFAGVAPRAHARALFDRGADVSHFRYFANAQTRTALCDWLLADDPEALSTFQTIRDAPTDMKPIPTAQATRAAGARDLPRVIVIPDVMATQLRIDGQDRVWLDPRRVADGALARIAWEQTGVDGDDDDVFDQAYGDLCRYLERSHRVERFPYDWRQPFDVLAERLAAFLSARLDASPQPLRLLAHGSGGLLVSACRFQRPAVINALMAREGARLILLGTPHHGSYATVEALLGKGETLRSLARLDRHHSLHELLSIFAGFPGLLQLLPRVGFVDNLQETPAGGEAEHRFQDAATWQRLQAAITDHWFGDRQSATPTQERLDAGSWLWRQEAGAAPSLPLEWKEKSVHVFGVAGTTPCAVHLAKTGLRMVGTRQGDGVVTWDSGRIDNMGACYWMPVRHGDLVLAHEYFPALDELLCRGATDALSRTAPAGSADEDAQARLYDAGPPTLTAGVALIGGQSRGRARARPRSRLEVTVKAMDLRFLSCPLLLGHYEQDPIAGAEALIDRELLDGDLSQRYSLGLYAGPCGTATVVLRVPNEQERRRGSLNGAVVCGLGAYDGSLTFSRLCEAVRAGVLRYLLQVIDVLGKDERELPLAALLLGYNSAANISVAASVEAVLRGVIEANARFQETTRLNIRVGRLDLVEVFQETAIAAAYALRQMPARLAELARRTRSEVLCRPHLVAGEGLRRRLVDVGGSRYWPRLMVTAAERPGGESGTRATRLVASETLRFLYIGQRARAEAVVQQRQPGLIEKLVRQQIHSTRWQEEFGRALFQLLVPNDFKDIARQLENFVLVVDEETANLPWEMMVAGARDKSGRSLPLAARTPVVRQLATAAFRREVRQGFEARALVVGNPAVEGFAKSFPDPDRPQAGDPSLLSGAEEEAKVVAQVLRGFGYTVVQAIGRECRAADVLTRLYQHAYRVLHVSAHGVFALRHVDGRQRTGVVLSDGLLITAAEIKAMEMVPELVFLNCCHLGQIQAETSPGVSTARTVSEGNLLAASIARELIGIGVRCVIVAGWAVDDRGAMIFGKTFYRSLLLEGNTFGGAVFEARQAVWADNPEDITWGAFQAYGDAAWRAEFRHPPAHSESDAVFAAPDELLDELSSRRASLSRATEWLGARETAAAAASLRRLLKDRCPPEWQQLTAVQSAVAAAWADLGDWESARESYLGAIQSSSEEAPVTIRDLEQLANVEARCGEQSAQEGLIDLALERLQRLLELGGDTEVTTATSTLPIAGSAAKRKAGLCARRLLAPGSRPGEDPSSALAAMDAALAQSAAFYRRGEGAPGDSAFSPYNALNRLAIEALLSPDNHPAPASIDLARHCRQAVGKAYRHSASFWDAIMDPESLLVERLLDRSLLDPGSVGQAAAEELARAYCETMSNLTVKPRELDSVVAQFGLLETFCRARHLGSSGVGWQLAAERLNVLADTIGVLQGGKRG